MVWLSSMTSTTFTFLSYVLAGAGVVVTIYMMFFLFFKYRLNQRQMRYQYYSEISDRHGLIILDDRTVIHKNGQLLVRGKRWGRPKAAKNVAIAQGEQTVTVSPEEEQELLSSQGSGRPQLPVPKP
jgi:hypothetical protein